MLKGSRSEKGGPPVFYDESSIAYGLQPGAELETTSAGFTGFHGRSLISVEPGRCIDPASLKPVPPLEGELVDRAINRHLGALERLAKR